MSNELSNTKSKTTRNTGNKSSSIPHSKTSSLKSKDKDSVASRRSKTKQQVSVAKKSQHDSLTDSHTTSVVHDIAFHTLDASFNDKQLLHWLAVQLNREPKPVDMYSVGKELYDSGMYKASAVFLAKYVEAPSSLLPGKHLLGYAYANLDEPALAVQQLKPCVNAGFDTDWQVLIEMELEVEKNEQRMQAITGALHASVLQAGLNIGDISTASHTVVASQSVTGNNVSKRNMLLDTRTPGPQLFASLDDNQQNNDDDDDDELFVMPRGFK